MSFSSLWFHFPFSSHFHHSQSFLLFPLHFSPSRDLLPASYLSRFLTFHSLSWSLPHFSFPLLVTSSLFHSLSWSLPLYFIPSPGHFLFTFFLSPLSLLFLLSLPNLFRRPALLPLTRLLVPYPLCLLPCLILKEHCRFHPFSCKDTFRSRCVSVWFSRARNQMVSSQPRRSSPVTTDALPPPPTQHLFCFPSFCFFPRMVPPLEILLLSCEDMMLTSLKGDDNGHRVLSGLKTVDPEESHATHTRT